MNMYEMKTAMHIIVHFKRIGSRHIHKDGWLCLTSHRQRGHLETAPPFTVSCKGREAWVLTPFPWVIELRGIAWQSITLPLHHASSTIYS